MRPWYSCGEDLGCAGFLSNLVLAKTEPHAGPMGEADNEGSHDTEVHKFQKVPMIRTLIVSVRV